MYKFVHCTWKCTQKCEGAIQFLICGHSVTAVYIFCLVLLVMALKGEITSWNYDRGIAIHTYLLFTVPTYLQLPYTYRCTPPTSYCLHHTLTVHLDSPCCSELLAFPAQFVLSWSLALHVIVFKILSHHCNSVLHAVADHRPKAVITTHRLEISASV